MQTLGISDSTPRSEGLLKSLFWPSVQNAADVDYLGAQGYWLCFVFGVLSLVVAAATGHPIAGILSFALYYFSGVGVREGSRYAAAIAFVFSLLELFGGPSILKIAFVILMFANLRATWIASAWNPASDEAASQPRFNETFADKLADQLPRWLWPKVRVVYYVFSIAFTALTLLGIGLLMMRGAWPIAPR